MNFTKRTSLWLAASLVLGCTLTLSSFAGKPGGKGGGGGTPPPLPEGLNVRYRVQYLPLPIDYTAAPPPGIYDVNDVYSVVGSYDVGSEVTGFYYDALTDTLLTANDMISLPAEWVSTKFMGVNNLGAIVGYVRDVNGLRNGLLIYPDGFGGYSFDLYSLTATTECYFRKINDFGDIAGVYYDLNGVPDAFAYNPGLYDPQEYLPATPFGLAGAFPYSIEVTNARRATGWNADTRYWFDFLDGQFSPIVYPADGKNYGAGSGLSQDGQMTFTEVSGTPNKPKYTPGVIVDGQYTWKGDLGAGQSQVVNSISGNNTVGDILGSSTASNHLRFSWLRYADHPEWGYIVLENMLVFSSTADSDRWALDRGTPGWMSDRDPLTGFGLMSGYSDGGLFVLLPEFSQ